MNLLIILFLTVVGQLFCYTSHADFDFLGSFGFSKGQNFNLPLLQATEVKTAFDVALQGPDLERARASGDLLCKLIGFPGASRVNVDFYHGNGSKVPLYKLDPKTLENGINLDHSISTFIQVGDLVGYYTVLNCKYKEDYSTESPYCHEGQNRTIVPTDILTPFIKQSFQSHDDSLKTKPTRSQNRQTQNNTNQRTNSNSNADGHSEQELSPSLLWTTEGEPTETREKLQAYLSRKFLEPKGKFPREKKQLFQTYQIAHEQLRKFGEFYIELMNEERSKLTRDSLERLKIEWIDLVTNQQYQFLQSYNPSRKAKLLESIYNYIRDQLIKQHLGLYMTRDEHHNLVLHHPSENPDFDKLRDLVASAFKYYNVKADAGSVSNFTQTVVDLLKKRLLYGHVAKQTESEFNTELGRKLEGYPESDLQRQDRDARDRRTFDYLDQMGVDYDGIDPNNNSYRQFVFGQKDYLLDKEKLLLDYLDQSKIVSLIHKKVTLSTQLYRMKHGTDLQEKDPITYDTVLQEFTERMNQHHAKIQELNEEISRSTNAMDEASNKRLDLTEQIQRNQDDEGMIESEDQASAELEEVRSRILTLLNLKNPNQEQKRKIAALIAEASRIDRIRILYGELANTSEKLAEENLKRAQGLVAILKSRNEIKLLTSVREEVKKSTPEFSVIRIQELETQLARVNERLETLMNSFTKLKSIEEFLNWIVQNSKN